MELCFSSLGRETSLEEDLRLVSEAGFRYIELEPCKINTFLEKHSCEQLESLVASFPVAPLTITGIAEISFRNSENHESAIENCKRFAEIARLLKCEYLSVLPGKLPDEGLSDREIENETITILREFSKLSQAYDRGIALELIGFADSSVKRLSQALKIIYRADRINLGLVLDTFHMYLQDTPLENLEEVDPRKLFVCRLNDCEDRPREELRNEHKLLPSEGIIALKPIVAKLQSIGYNGALSVEPGCLNYKDWEPVELAQTAKEKMEVLFEGVSCKENSERHC